MTTLATRIVETPMAPYTEILRNMKPQEMRIVVTFLQEAMAEAENNQESAAEKIRNKYKKLHVSKETKELIHDLSLSSDEMDDDRTKHILGYK